MSLARIEDVPSLLTEEEQVRKLGRHYKCHHDRHPPVHHNTVDYQTLNWLVQLDGLSDGYNRLCSTDEAHSTFMNNYKRMLLPNSKPKPLPQYAISKSSAKNVLSETSLHSNSTSKSVAAGSLLTIDQSTPRDQTGEPLQETFTHNISDYLIRLHRQRKSEKPEAIKRDGIKNMRKILRKLPFDRNVSENHTLFNILKSYPMLSKQVNDDQLKELCMVAQLETWKTPEFTIFGNSGFHLILKGSVRALSHQYYRLLHESELGFTSPVPFDRETDNENLPKLKVGDCFGTLKKIEGRATNTRVLSVVTSEPVELLKISASDFHRTMEQMNTRDQTEKVNLLQSCPSYKMWTRQPLLAVGNLITWKTFPANTVIVTEGFKAPFLGYIKSGMCHVLRQAETIHTLRNGKKERRTKQVVMGNLGPSESFGEISVLNDEPITCSIVTAKSTVIGVIFPARLSELNDITRQLLLQSSQKTFGQVTQEEIHDEYMKQELKREWNEFKHSIVVDVINGRGIRPGHGKWAK
ncbi:cyclic nucleotide-binding domain-containing protein 1-like [Tubulanus polymorphus]|uniref:cyclic nucleotide-binding domain-containing protein 1-like n=1 Tax=Tubulanus polymorphus TaxID=672921 RepID=UPI003DA2B94E